ncbi:MAG: ParB/RepB/Spo0J family partition protein [Prevotellaceae bacterium]|jgi:ParB family chromosome partitioning protein|nr:ParB/RepB/Spo0J family partition protein [Prevotellaceae bacterium]
MSKKTGLGRGLGALIETNEVSTSGSLSMSEIELDKIEANPNQPRTVFDDEALAELAVSIRELGVIQPITLRKVNINQYQIISGERRFRASKLAGLTAIPAYVKDVEDNVSIEMMALIENIQREDLNAIEIALSFQKLIDEYKLTQEQLSDKVGKKRATVSNYLRLLRLPAAVQKAVREKDLDMGHAKALAGIKDLEMQLVVFDQIIKDGLTVRNVEELAQTINNPQEETPETPTEKPQPKEKPQKKDFEIFQNELSSLLNTKVQFAANSNGKGKISISFSNKTDLERIIELLTVSKT